MKVEPSEGYINPGEFLFNYFILLDKLMLSLHVIVMLLINKIYGLEIIL
jgi:hypothetical protein